MKIWVDSTRSAPDDSYIWCKSVNEAIALIESIEADTHIDLTRNRMAADITIIDLSTENDCHGENGEECVDILYWVQENWRPYPVTFHADRKTRGAYLELR
jgi:hypothetical protein